jgi:hypothetical protein
MSDVEPKVDGRKKGNHSRSSDAAEIVSGGVTAHTLAEMFLLDIKEVRKRIVGKVHPVSGTLASGHRYRVREAAPYLVEGIVDPSELFERLSPNKWPPVLQDAFWKAQNNKQKWEENRGDLWRTERVYEVVSEAFKEIRLTVLMFADTISQRSELTALQRQIVQELGDGLLASLGSRLTEHFAFYENKPDEHGESLNQAQAAARSVGDAPPAEEEEVDPFA